MRRNTEVSRRIVFSDLKSPTDVYRLFQSKHLAYQNTVYSTIRIAITPAAPILKPSVVP